MSLNLLDDGLKALQKQQYPEAVVLLGNFCQNYQDRNSAYYMQGLMALARAYRHNGQPEKAIALAQTLVKHPNQDVHEWAQSFLSLVNQDQDTNRRDDNSPQFSRIAERAGQTGIRLMMPKMADSLKFASGFTLMLLLGMVLVLCLGLCLIIDSDNPGLGLIISIVVTLVFNGVTFLLSPMMMDLTQTWLYKTRWVNLAEIQRHSPEAADVILRVCREKQLSHPRLGIIDDQNPTAFTYGSFPGNARLVVSQGLFTYLNDEEIAAVYAHELGHIVHWDFAIMTLASTLVQITYLIYLFARELGNKGNNDNKLKDGLKVASIAAYIFYIIGTYLMLYLSRTREYYADHFSAETTGNPNGLSRALVKIAYGITEESLKDQPPSRLIEGTRALGIADPKGVTATGTVYRMTSGSQRIENVFIWDLFNPWAKLTELNSTHPLTGKRIRALCLYAEQMNIKSQFNMANVVKDGNKLDQKKLWHSFFLELAMGNSHIIGGILGLMIGMGVVIANQNFLHLLILSAIGFGLGLMIRTIFVYPDFQKCPDSDIFTLMCDPYGSPVRGKPVQLNGQLIGRGEAGYVFGSDLKLQDRTGMIFLRYASRFGALGNFLFGVTQVTNLVGTSVGTMGWFRRGVTPWFDLIELSNGAKTVKSYHRFGGLFMGFIIVTLGALLPLFIH